MDSKVPHLNLRRSTFSLVIYGLAPQECSQSVGILKVFENFGAAFPEGIDRFRVYIAARIVVAGIRLLSFRNYADIGKFVGKLPIPWWITGDPVCVMLPDVTAYRLRTLSCTVLIHNGESAV